MRWAAKDADPIRAFGQVPPECLTRPADPAQALSVEVGRAAFRTPVLLGGQAARAGVACETCHKNGRRNPDFLFPGVSGAPGTADVTDELFSSHRGDGIANPFPIKDLSGPKSAFSISQDPAARKLEPFIHGQIVEEFDGDEPPAAVLQGLADYVRRLSPEACPAAPSQPVSIAYYMADVRRALAAARAEAVQGDGATARLMVASARTRLGLIDERFGAPALAAERERLRAAAAELARIQAALHDRGPGAVQAIDRWLAASEALQAGLEAKAGLSLFDPARLRAAAKGRAPA
jgi:hypothetical protein